MVFRYVVLCRVGCDVRRERGTTERTGYGIRICEMDLRTRDQEAR